MFGKKSISYHAMTHDESTNCKLKKEEHHCKTLSDNFSIAMQVVLSWNDLPPAAHQCTAAQHTSLCQALSWHQPDLT
jgi:hypothetical protein